MTERRPPLERVIGVAGEVAAALRRGRHEHPPRVVVYDPDGQPWALAPEAPGYDELVELAEQLAGADPKAA